MLVAVAGMSHRSAPVEVRERVAFPPCAGRPFLRRLIDEGIASEAVLLSTCNRTEVYVVAEGAGARTRVLDLLAEDRNVDRASLDGDTYWLTDDEAVRHLYRVASSLDSMVVGEAQILGQVREAYRSATEERCTGPILNRLFTPPCGWGRTCARGPASGTAPSPCRTWRSSSQKAFLGRCAAGGPWWSARGT